MTTRSTISPALLLVLVTLGGCAAPPAPAPQAPPPQAPLTLAGPATLTTPGGRVIQIELTEDVDAHERIPLTLAGGDPNEFRGSDRRRAKLSLVNEPVEEFGSVEDLIDSLPADDDMINRDPAISRGRNSRRVAEERRQVAVTTLLRAAAKEDDNDFHLILCDEPGQDPTCLNVEISGLPPSGRHRAALTAARSDFSDLLAGSLPGRKYAKYNPPIPVRVSGALFYDISHDPGEVGPQGLRPETSWEIHPVATIEEQ